MRFWDSSALVPLLVVESTSNRLNALLDSDDGVVTWWGSELECVSALARRERGREIESTEGDDALARLDALSRSWQEIEPAAQVRQTARRLLRVHALSAADALQLAAAVVAAEGHPASLELVTLDERLADAARREGFTLSVPAT